MDIIDRKLIGKDLCGHECVDNNSVIHPETCTDQVLTECSGSKTLTEWIDGDSDQEVHHGSFNTYHSLIEWLNANYPRDTYSLPIATYSNITSPHIGGIMVDPAYLTLSNSGILGVNVSALNIPSISAATFSTQGIVKLGNDTVLNNNFANTTITDTDVALYPLRADSNGCTGIAIPNSSLEQKQVDWSQSDESSVDYIKHKPEIPTVNNSKITIKQGDITKGQFTLNQSTPNTIILDTVDNYNDFTGATDEDNGTNGLVPAPMISDRTKFLKGDGSWGFPTGQTYTAGDNISINNNVISANIIEYNKLDSTAEGHISGEPYVVTGSGYDETTEEPKKFLREDGDWKEIETSYTLPLANNGIRGGIQLGYVQNGKNYPVLLDGEKAYVNVPWNEGSYELPAAQHNVLGGIKTGFSSYDKNYKVELDNDNNAFVNVPWTDTNTTYSSGDNITINNNIVNLTKVEHNVIQSIDSTHMAFDVKDHSAYTFEIGSDISGNIIFYIPEYHSLETSIKITNPNFYTTAVKLIFYGVNESGYNTDAVNTIVIITKSGSTTDLRIVDSYMDSISDNINCMIISIRHKVAYVYLRTN